VAWLLRIDIFSIKTGDEFLTFTSLTGAGFLAGPFLNTLHPTNEMVRKNKTGICLNFIIKSMVLLPQIQSQK
jgi:hypothetical protein